MAPPVLMYRDPTDGTYKPLAVPGGGSGGGADEVVVGSTAPTDPAIELWVDTGSVGGGGLAFADEAARDAAISAPTDGMTCYLVNRKAHTTFHDDAWHPAPGTSTVQMFAEIAGAYPGNVVPTYPTLELMWETGCPLGTVSGPVGAVRRGTRGRSAASP